MILTQIALQNTWRAPHAWSKPNFLVRLPAVRIEGIIRIVFFFCNMHVFFIDVSWRAFLKGPEDISGLTAIS